MIKLLQVDSWQQCEACLKQYWRSCSVVGLFLCTNAPLKSTLTELMVVWGALVASLTVQNQHRAAVLAHALLCCSTLQPVMWGWQQLRLAQNVLSTTFVVVSVLVCILARVLLLKRSAAATCEGLLWCTYAIAARWNSFCMPWTLRTCCMHWLLAMDRLAEIPAPATARELSAALRVALVLYDLAQELQVCLQLYDIITSLNCFRHSALTAVCSSS
jgi:hypothetical protein